MTLREDIFAALTAGSPTPIRVYFTDTLPQQLDLPVLTFHIVGGHDEMHLQGRAGLISRLVQLDTWAMTRLSADALMREARDLMLIASTFTVDAINETAAEGFEPDTRRYRTSYEFTLWAQDP